MRKKGMAVIAACVLLLTACGGPTVSEHGNDGGTGRTAEERTDNSGWEQEDRTGNTQEQDSVQWTLEETPLPSPEDALEELIPEGGKAVEILCGMAGDTVYRVARLYRPELEAVGNCVQTLSPPYTAWENAPVFWRDEIPEDWCYDRAAALGGDGSVYFFLSAAESSYLAEWTADGGFTTEVLPAGIFEEEIWEQVSKIYVDADQTFYVLSNAGVQYYDRTFSEKTRWSDTGYVCQILNNEQTQGKVYLCGAPVEGGFRVWDDIQKHTPLFTSDQAFMDSNSQVALVNSTDGFLCNASGIWKFEGKSGELEERVSFQEQGYSVEKIFSAAAKEDGALKLLAQVGGRLVFLESRKEEAGKDKAELEYASTMVSPFFRKAVVNFNKQSEDCQIVLRLPREGEDWIDFRTKIQAELSSGEGPALLDGRLFDLEAAAQRGFLRDLTELFDSQESELTENEILKQEILENVWSDGIAEGKRYAVPYSFSVNTLVTGADMTGGRKNWSRTELMQCVRSSAASSAVSCMDSAALFYTLGIYGGRNTSLIDWDRRESRLNGEEAKELLEFCKEYGDDKTYEDAGSRLAAGEVLAESASVGSFHLPVSWEAIFQGNTVYMGFPAEDQQSVNFLCSESIAVNQSCAYRGGAEAFLRYLLSEEIQDQMAEEMRTTITGGFPVRREAFEKVFASAGEQGVDSGSQGLWASYNGFEYLEEPLPPESLEKVRQLLLSAEPETRNTDEILAIVLEETRGYFSGEKPAQETLDILQNRVQLYLDEKN